MIMKLKIRDVYGENLEDERIVIDVVSDSENQENYILFDTTYNAKGEVSNKHRHPFFFKTTKLKKDEVILIYTKKGDNYLAKSSKQTKMYVLYWGLDACVWNNNKDNALLVHYDDYIGKII